MNDEYLIVIAQEGIEFKTKCPNEKYVPIKGNVLFKPYPQYSKTDNFYYLQITFYIFYLHLTQFNCF